jgi:hypothetical protein
MAQTPLQAPFRGALPAPFGRTPQSLRRPVLPIEDEHVRDNIHVSSHESPSSDPAVYDRTCKPTRFSSSSSPSTAHQLITCTPADIAILVHPIKTSSPQNLKDGYFGLSNERPIYAPGLPAYWAVPVLTHLAISSPPVVHGAPLSSAPSSSLPPIPPPPPAQVPANDRSGTQKEEDLIELERQILSSPSHAANALEPPCGSPDCPYLADCYGIRGMSWYTAFTIAKPDGTFGCWRAECSAYSARKLDDAVKHQRAQHFNHKPFLCVPTNGTVW